jgi:aminopeptidase N
LTFADELQPGSTAVLHIVFKGMLNESMNGFYRSSFKDNDGKTHYIATTQFEATDARKAFPCWDEVLMLFRFVYLFVSIGRTVTNFAPLKKKNATLL